MIVVRDHYRELNHLNDGFVANSMELSVRKTPHCIYNQ